MAEAIETVKRPRKVAKYLDRQTEWVLSDWYCTHCGAKDCWQPVNQGGDYYVEQSVTCGTCQHEQWCMDEVTNK